MTVKATRKELRKAFGTRAYDEVVALKHAQEQLAHAFAATASQIQSRAEHAEHEATSALAEVQSTMRAYGQFRNRSLFQRLRWVLTGQ